MSRHYQLKKKMIHNKENNGSKDLSLQLRQAIEQIPGVEKLKTEPSYIDYFRQNLLNPSVEFIKGHRPFLQNKKIIFNVRSNRQNMNSYHSAMRDRKETHIDKLKREIKELDKEDFISYRSKTNSYIDQTKVIENPKITKYNHQNSLIVELKGQNCQYHPVIKRPRSTVGRSCGSSSVPQKYFSKPRKAVNLQERDADFRGKTEILGQSLLNTTKLKFKPEDLVLGMNNMLRGRAKHKKNYSSFRLYD